MIFHNGMPSVPTQDSAPRATQTNLSKALGNQCPISSILSPGPSSWGDLCRYFA